MSLPIRRLLIFIWAISVCGCTSHQPNTAIVSQTLGKYQVGKTTFEDFQSDAKFAEVEIPLPQSKWNKSYLYPDSLGADLARMASPKTMTTFKFPKGSPWEIYEIGSEFSTVDGKVAKIDKYVVGDVKHPISILIFDENGNLIDVLPANPH